jgi:hypothetical protein
MHEAKTRNPLSCRYAAVSNVQGGGSSEISHLRGWYYVGVICKSATFEMTREGNVISSEETPLFVISSKEVYNKRRAGVPPLNSREVTSLESKWWHAFL